MEKRTTVLVADGSEEFCARLSGALQNGGYQVVGTATDGQSAAEQLKASSPDVMILDLMLPKGDGLSVIGSVPKEKRPKLLLLAGLATDYVLNAASAAGADYLMLKPCTAQTVAQRVGDILQADRESTARRQSAEPDIETMVTNVIHEIGVPAHIKGYQYLREAIIIAVGDMEVINASRRSSIPRWPRPSVPRPPGWSGPSATPLRWPGTGAIWTPSSAFSVTPFPTPRASPPTASSLP